MNKPEKKYWFPAKRYDWGWGMPTCWQGWVMTVVYFAFFFAGTAWLTLGDRADVRNKLPVFHSGLVVLSIAFVIICLLKGEPPSRRRGDKR